MKNIKIIALCCLLILAFSKEATSSVIIEKCAMPTIKVAYNRSKAVFVGKALSESKEGDIRTFNFQVEKYWKGATKKNITVNVYETMRYQAGFIVGERYLVFTHLRDDGKLYDARCSGTKLLSQASIDVRELGRAKTPSR